MMLVHSVLYCALQYDSDHRYLVFQADNPSGNYCLDSDAQKITTPEMFEVAYITTM